MPVVPRGCPLKPVDLEVLQMMSDGLTYSEIAFRLGRSFSTVRSRVTKIYRLLEVPNQAQAVITARSMGWIEGHQNIDKEAETKILVRLEQAVGELVHIMVKRQKITEKQRRFLSAFDAVLYAREDDEYVAARAMMSEALGEVAEEAGLELTPRRKGDLVELIADYVITGQHRNRPHLRLAA